MTTAAVLERLRGAALDELVALVVDHLLDRPVAELVDPGWVAEQIIVTLEATTRDESTQEWLRDRVRDLRQRVPDGVLGDRVPSEVRDPLRQVVGRPVVWDRALVGRLLDHDAARHLVTDILQAALQSFVKKLKPVTSTVASSVKGTKSFGRLKMLSQGVRGIGENVLGGLSGEIEHRAEQRVREFVDTALDVAMDQVADHICDPGNAARYADYRIHIVDVILTTENETLAAEVDKLDPDHVVDVVAAVARSFARREGFKDELAAILQQGMEGAGGRTLRDFLADTGLGDQAEAEGEWRRGLEQQVATQARVFIETPAFAAWLDRLLNGDP